MLAQAIFILTASKFFVSILPPVFNNAFLITNQRLGGGIKTPGLVFVKSKMSLFFSAYFFSFSQLKIPKNSVGAIFDLFDLNGRKFNQAILLKYLKSPI